MRRISFSKKASEYIAERKTAPCFICEIIAGKSRRKRHHILYEDGATIVFLSAFPTQYGHILVCPKRHVEQIVKEITVDEYLNLQRTVYLVAGAVEKVTKPERVYIASFGSNQMNRHVHFHIVPLPVGTPILEQQMASMMPEKVGILQLDETEWNELASNIRKEIKKCHGI